MTLLSDYIDFGVAAAAAAVLCPCGSRADSTYITAAQVLTLRQVSCPPQTGALLKSLARAHPCRSCQADVCTLIFLPHAGISFSSTRSP